MLLEIFIFSLVGTALGIILGLLPGLHLNNVLPILISLSFLIQNPYYLVVLIVATVIAQVFTSFIPSIFLGAPDGDSNSNSLSILPGHRLLLEGRGYEAIKLTVIGGLGAVMVSTIVILLFGNYFTVIHNVTRPYISYAIITVVLFMIFSEKQINKILLTGGIILLSGIFGVVTLNSSLVQQQNILFPVFTGLFAISTLLVSITEKSNMPEQKTDSKLGISKSDIVKAIGLSVVAGILVGLLPAIGVSQAATFMQYLGGMGQSRPFLVTLSGINTANEVVSLNSLYLISNPRSGASVAIERILPQLSMYDMLLFTGVILFTTGLIVPITLYLGKTVPRFLVKVNYNLLSYLILGFLVLMIGIMTGGYGLLIGITATSIGVLCAHLGVKRSSCMGVLIVPSVLFFLGLNPLIFTILNI
ncbi:MAG: tripartite tricarboxylate transporter permease [Candidatus Aenigmarchaeota archaeon]|nr:tripartite tricarboxylate transporter permease [Candidatus Aenigmarchaeota archaeon]